MSWLYHVLAPYDNRRSAVAVALRRDCGKKVLTALGAGCGEATALLLDHVYEQWLWILSQLE